MYKVSMVWACFSSVNACVKLPDIKLSNQRAKDLSHHRLPSTLRRVSHGTLMHQSMYSRPSTPTPGNSGGIDLKRDHFHLYSTTSWGTIFNKFHCPHEEHPQTIALPR